ncbi:MAG: ABC transporter ATP-binding protein [Acidimicrobiia bacterium]
MLEVEGLTTRYGSITGLRDASIVVRVGEIVGIMGPNGAGKTTLLNTIIGLLRPSAGRIVFRDDDVTGLSPEAMLRRGIALVPEQRRLFSELTVEENLLVAGVTSKAVDRHKRLTEVMDLFPVLGDRATMPAGFLSGGEAQQLAIGRGLMSGPELLLMDEPTLGLAPSLVTMVFDLVERLRKDGTTLVVVEQNARRLLEIADRAYLLRTGNVVAEATADALKERDDLFDVYLGAAE